MSGLAARLKGCERTLRSIGIGVVAVVAIVIFVAETRTHQPLARWMSFRYALAFFLSLTFAASCLCGGHMVTSRLYRRRPAVREHLVISFAAGVLVFYLGGVAIGLLGGYGPVFFVAWPLALVAWGGRSLYAYLARWARGVRHVRRIAPPWTLWQCAIVALGLLGVLFVYFPILAGDNIAYDARWYHLALAEHYNARGALRAFPEGWLPGTYPQLASQLYTWAFALPGGELFDRVILSAHVEFVIFLATLAGLPVLVRRLVGGSASWSWVSLFLFPGIFVYDSSLTAAADHVAAFWAVPMYLLLLRAWRRLDVPDVVAFAAVCAGAFVTKYTSITMVAPAVLAFGLRVGILGVRGLFASPERRVRVVLPAVLAGVTFLAVSAPHWLKNWVWYGDPLYPTLYKHLSTLHPWTPDAVDHFENFFLAQLWRPTRDLAGLRESLSAMFTFSFQPHEYPYYHGQVPVFGSLYTLMLLCLPLFARPGKLIGLAVIAQLNIFLWYWMNHADRYLQSIVPWMAALCAAVIERGRGLFWPARALLAGLVALQVIWGLDTPFIPSHAMLGDTVLKHTATLLSAGFRKSYAEQVHVPGMAEVAPLLPKGSIVLVHEIHQHLGLGAMSINDYAPWQAAINYRRLGTPRAVHEKLRSLGVTHLIWEPHVAKEQENMAGSLVFHDFVARFAVGARRVGSVMLAQLPATPPPEEEEPWVAFVGCGGTYPSGLYKLSDLAVTYVKTYPQPRKPDPASSSIPPEARLAVVENCKALPAEALAAFQPLAVRSGARLYGRNAAPSIVPR